MDYKERLEKAKELYPTANADQRYVLENLFPELKESEDERIRKALIKFHKSTIDIDGIKGEQIIAWLEKQGESYTKRDIDDAFVEGMALAKNELEKQGQQKLANSAKTCKKSQCMISAEAKEALYDKPAWKPSDEQMRALNYVVNLMASSESPKENDYYYNVFKDLREQLKKLREE